MTTQSVKENLSQGATRPKMGWSILRMVVLSIIVGILAAGLAKLLLMAIGLTETCLLYTSPSPRDGLLSRMPSSA